MSYNLPNQIIDASGNKIGIGTTAPEYRLDVRSSGAHSQVFAVQGAQGRLLSVDDNLSSGTLFSVSNITGLSSFEVNASGDVELAEFGNSITAHKPILISGGVPVITTNKLYNNNGTLSWNGSQVSTSAGAGSPSGIAFFDASGNLSSTPDLTIGSGTTGEGLNLGRPLYIDSPSASFLSVLRYNGSEKFRFNYNQFYPDAAGGGTSLGKSDAYWGHFFSRNAYLKGHTAAHVALTINGNSAQSANLTEWQDSVGDNLATVTNSGFFETSEGMYIYGSGKPGDTSYHRLFIGKDNDSYDKYKIASEGASKNIDFHYGSDKVMTITGQIYAWKDLVPASNNSKKLGDNRRWSEVNTADISISGVATFLQDDGSATDVFYSGNSLVMELPNKNFEIRGKDGNQFINFQDAGNNAVNVGASLYPAGNKQTNFGVGTLRWKTLYGGNADLETYNVAVPTLALRNIGSQTADLTQWQDSSSNVLAYVNKDGHAHFPSLSVSGDFTYVNSENVTIFDKQIELASLSGSAVSGDALVDEGGFVLKSTDGDKQFIWRDYDDAWTSNQNISLTSGNGIYVYNSGAGNTDYERLEVKWDTNEAQVATTRGGTGQFRGVYTGILDGSTKRQGFLIDSTLVSSYWSLGSQCYIFSSLSFRPNGSRILGNSSNRWSTTYTKTIDVEAGSAADVPSVIKGAASQSANLTEWKDSAGDVLSKITSDGSIHVSGNIVSESDGEIRSYILGKPGDTDTEYLRIGDLGGIVHEITPHTTGSGQNRHIRIASADGRGKLNLYNDGHLNYFFNNTHTFSAFSWGISVSGEIRSMGSPRASLGQSTQPFSAGYLDEVYTSGVRTSGIYINDNVPASTSNQLYNDAGTLKWNGSSLSTSTITGNPSGVAFFGDDSGLTNVDKLVYASGDDGDNLEHGYHLYKSGAGTANWERAEIGWGRTGGNAPGRFYIGLNEGGTGNNSYDMRIAARQIDFKVGTTKTTNSLSLGTSAITTYMRVVPGAANSVGDTLGHTTVPYGRLFLGDLDGSLRFNNDTYIGRPASGVLVVTSGTGYENAVFRAGRFEAEGVHTDVTPLEVKGAIGQTANLTEWKDGVGDTLASVDSAANLYVSGQLQYSTHGHKIYAQDSYTTRFQSTYFLFRSGSHSVSFNTFSNGGVSLSPAHKLGWKSSPTAILDPTIYFKQYNFDSVAVETSAGLATLIASGVNTSGVYLADHVPVDRTDTIYNSGGTMTWDGAFAAETKSFLIDHPIREGMKLQYACLEGPENGAYVRGTTTTEIIELPDYWTGLVDEESITVQLTPKSHSQNTYVSGIMNNRVYLISDTDIDVYYNVYGTRKDVAPLEVEW